MTDFTGAWTTFSADSYVRVSNALPEPSNETGNAWRHWRSHNFVGKLTHKHDGPPRVLRFELAPRGGATVTYEIIEGVAHSFESSNADAFLLG